MDENQRKRNGLETLSDDDWKAILRRMAEKSVSAKCFVCGKEAGWKRGAHIPGLIRVGTLNEDAYSFYPAVMTSCKNCGHMRLFDPSDLLPEVWAVEGDE